MKQLSLFPRSYDQPTQDYQRDILIASWNVNSIRARKNQVVDWLRRVQPDVLCLQETKVKDNTFPREVFEAEGYEPLVFGQERYNGVAILSRHPISNVRKGLQDGQDDSQARLVSGDILGINIVCLYAPNARSVTHESFSHKIAWLDRLENYLRINYGKGDDVILCGDFNVAPYDHDVFDVKSWLCKTFIHPQAREAFGKVISWGLVDLLHIHGECHSFTWWDHGDGFEKERGMRLDHLLVSEGLASRVSKVWVDKDARVIEKPSDHAPIIGSFTRE